MSIREKGQRGGADCVSVLLLDANLSLTVRSNKQIYELLVRVRTGFLQSIGRPNGTPSHLHMRFMHSR